MNSDAKKIYRALLLFCAFYFFAVAAAHQAGIKLPMLFVFYKVPSERYQDLIISFLSFGWAALFMIGYLDITLRSRIQLPILIAGIGAFLGLIRATAAVQYDIGILYEICALGLLLAALVTAYLFAVKKEYTRCGPD